jgi:hypothetical protein
MTIDPSAVNELIALVKEYDVPLSWQKIYLRGYHIYGELELPVVGAFDITDDWPAELLEKVNELPGSNPLAALRYSLDLHFDLIGKCESV